MKISISKTRKTIVALMALIATTFSDPVMANNGPEDPVAFEVKYLGVLQNNPVFEAILKNVEGDTFIVRVLDANGNVLYIDKLEGKNISRRYRIDTVDKLESGSVSFEIKSLKSKKSQTYTIKVKESYEWEVAAIQK